MLYIITIVLFAFWSILVIRKGDLSWHSVAGLYVTTLLAADTGDVACDYWLNLYDLPGHLLKNPASDHYLGIVFSDGIILPLIAIIFCHYSVKHHRPWLLSFLFAAILGIMEVLYRQLGYMVYHHWSPWVTTLLAFIAFRILAEFAGRFVHRSPPVSYRFRLLCATYVITEWPGAVLSGIMHLYKWRPHLFADPYADDRFTAMTIAVVMGGLAAYLAPKFRDREKPFLFLGLGLVSTVFALWASRSGLLRYYRWDHLWTVVRYMTPYLLVFWYDQWESASAKGEPPLVMW